MGEKYVGRRFRTVYVKGEAPDTHAVEAIIAAGKRLNDLGLTPENAGNISLRAEDGMLITVGGRNKGELTPRDIVEVVAFDFEEAKVVGESEPSSETPMHWLIYQCYPQARAVIHAHDELALEKAALLKERIGAESTPTAAAYGTQEQAHMVVEALEHCQYAIISGHGVVCIGETLGEALDLVVKVRTSLRGPAY
jgi:ribulose-5-phosphate 4-epimerase/fuculose-1-phosphate aldolase